MDRATGSNRIQVRRFLAVLCGVFLFLYAGTVGLQWSLLRWQAMADAEANAQAITELLVAEIGETEPVAELLQGLDEPARYATFDRAARHKTAKFGLKNTKLYRRDKSVVYAEDRALIGLAFPHGMLLEGAFRGEVGSRVLSAAEYLRRYGAGTTTSMVETYIPLWRNPQGEVDYVLEAYQDFEPTRARLGRVLWASAVLTILIISLALATLTIAYHRIHRLQSKVASLESLLPICSDCRKIRVDETEKPARWLGMEDYFRERDHVEFSHGLCADCLARRKAQLIRKSNARHR